MLCYALTQNFQWDQIYPTSSGINLKLNIYNLKCLCEGQFSIASLRDATPVSFFFLLLVKRVTCLCNSLYKTKVLAVKMCAKHVINYMALKRILLTIVFKRIAVFVQ